MPNIFDRSVQFEHIEILGDGKIEWKGVSAANKSVEEIRVSGDPYPRFTIEASGRLQWGPGNIGLDVALSRAAVNMLQLIDDFLVWERVIMVMRSNLGDTTYVSGHTSDVAGRFNVIGSGDIYFGIGSIAPETRLFRRAAYVLNTPDRFEAGSLGVGNSQAGTSPGNVTRKIQVFDDAGASLGYLPVYDAIT